MKSVFAMDRRNSCLQLGIAVMTTLVAVSSHDIHRSRHYKRQAPVQPLPPLASPDQNTQASDHGPSAIHAHAKFFQDFFSVQLSPYKLEFGHVCEDPDEWEQRYERKDFKNHRDQGKVIMPLYAHVPHKDHYEIGHRQGNDHHFNERHEKAHPESGEFKAKVRWGDKYGGYGEHYWDFNHAGHGHDDSHDDGSDHVSDYSEPDYDTEKTRDRRHELEYDTEKTRDRRHEPEYDTEKTRDSRHEPDYDTAKTRDRRHASYAGSAVNEARAGPKQGLYYVLKPMYD